MPTDNPKYRPVNDSELIENIRRTCVEEIERISFVEEDCKEFNEPMSQKLLGRVEGYQHILNKIENREYLRKQIK